MLPKAYTARHCAWPGYDHQAFQFWLRHFWGDEKVQNTSREFLFTSFDFNAKELSYVGFSVDSTLTINQANHTISRILQRPKVKYVKQLGRLSFSPLIQVYNKNTSNEKNLIILWKIGLISKCSTALESLYPNDYSLQSHGTTNVPFKCYNKTLILLSFEIKKSEWRKSDEVCIRSILPIEQSWFTAVEKQ